MLRIGLLGYGKMGKTIDGLVQGPDKEIVWRISRENAADLNVETLRKADVVIEFSRPEAAFGNVIACLEAGVAVVSGTTGWHDKLSEAEDFCRSRGGAMLWASNFSIGVNLFFALNRYLAALMDARPEYRPELVETHHIHKLDAPSGTALTLVKDLLAQSTRLEGYQLVEPDSAKTPDPKQVPVTAIRTGEVPGTHLISWQSDIDAITIEHRADSRLGFARGALHAAQWIAGRKGVFTMNDVLNIH